MKDRKPEGPLLEAEDQEPMIRCPTCGTILSNLLDNPPGKMRQLPTPAARSKQRMLKPTDLGGSSIQNPFMGICLRVQQRSGGNIG